MTLGQRILEQRKAMGLSQEQLGEKLGVSRQAISKWEADGAVPEVDKLIALGRFFGLSLNELLQVDCPAAAPQDEAAAAEYARRARLKRVWRDAGHILTGILVLAFAVSLAVLWVRVDRLETRLGEAARPTAALDAGALVAAWDFHVQAQSSAGKVLYINVTPTRVVEGMTVSFQASDADMETRTVAANESKGTFYSAILTVPTYVTPTISVIFALDGVQYVQPLADFNSLTETGSSWTPLLELK